MYRKVNAFIEESISRQDKEIKQHRNGSLDHAARQKPTDKTKQSLASALLKTWTDSVTYCTYTHFLYHFNETEHCI